MDFLLFCVFWLAVVIFCSTRQQVYKLLFLLGGLRADGIKIRQLTCRFGRYLIDLSPYKNTSALRLCVPYVLLHKATFNKTAYRLPCIVIKHLIWEIKRYP
jgi:hypothetical protein